MSKPDPIDTFDGTSISYTYDNGWEFTNTFEGRTRVTITDRRGELREPIQIHELRPNLFFISWVDGEMGLLAQILDLENRTVMTAIPVEGDDVNSQTIIGEITHFDGHSGSRHS